jgi:hypothetical protein
VSKTIAKAEFVAKAREYLGTPIRHQGRRKGPHGAVDCIGLLLCVGEDLGIVDKHGVPTRRTDYLNYLPVPGDRFVHEECVKRLIQKSGAPEPGDVITLRVPMLPCHLAIVSSLQGSIGMIHATTSRGSRDPRSQHGKVVEHILDGNWRWRIEGVFAVPGLS